MSPQYILLQNSYSMSIHCVRFRILVLVCVRVSFYVFDHVRVPVCDIFHVRVCMFMQFVHSACSCSMEMQHRHAVCAAETCRMDMQQLRNVEKKFRVLKNQKKGRRDVDHSPPFASSFCNLTFHRRYWPEMDLHTLNTRWRLNKNIKKAQCLHARELQIVWYNYQPS
jgi:hypothetical protein